MTSTGPAPTAEPAEPSEPANTPAAPNGAEPGGAEPSGAEPSGAEPSGAEPSGAEPSGAEPSGAEPGGAATTPRSGPAAGPTRLARWFPWVGGGLAVAFVLWRFGGSGVTFDVDATADPGTSFDWGFFWALVPSFAGALWVTVQATVAGVALAMVIGLVLALGRRSPRRIVRWPFAFFIEFIRSTPLLIQLFFIFFALPRLGWLPDSISVLSPLTALIIGLGIHYGTYCSESYRAGIDSVPVGQWEAATAMNLPLTTTWRRVILPQAVPNVLPALGNYLIAGFKDAPLGSSIQVTGVLFFARTMTSRTFRPVEAYTLVGVGFLLVSISAAFLLRRLERRLSYDRA